MSSVSPVLELQTLSSRPTSTLHLMTPFSSTPLLLTPTPAHIHSCSHPLLTLRHTHSSHSLLTPTPPHTHSSSHPQPAGSPRLPGVRAADTLTRRRGPPRSCCSASGTSWLRGGWRARVEMGAARRVATSRLSACRLSGRVCLRPRPRPRLRRGLAPRCLPIGPGPVTS